MNSFHFVLAVCLISLATVKAACDASATYQTSYITNGHTSDPVKDYAIGQDSLCKRNPNVSKTVWLSPAWKVEGTPFITCGKEIAYTVDGVGDTAFVSGFGTFTSATTTLEECGQIVLPGDLGNSQSQVIWKFTGNSAIPPKR